MSPRARELNNLDQPPNGQVRTDIGYRDYMEDRHVIALLTLT